MFYIVSSLSPLLGRACNLALKKKGKSKKIDNLSSLYYTFSTAVSTADLMFVKGKKSKQFVISEAAQTVLLDLVL